MPRFGLTIAARTVAMSFVLVTCQDEPTPCADDSDCRSGERCNTIRDECQEVFAAQQGEPCSIAEHCDDDLVCPDTTCESNAYGPCDSTTQTGCGGDHTCSPWMIDPVVGGACTLDCERDDECPADGFGDRAAPTCLPVRADGGGLCGVPCSDDADCGSETSFYEQPAQPRCSALGACYWTIGL